MCFYLVKKTNFSGFYVKHPFLKVSALIMKMSTFIDINGQLIDNVKIVSNKLTWPCYTDHHY